jgi:hypothetical protein
MCTDIDEHTEFFWVSGGQESCYPVTIHCPVPDSMLYLASAILFSWYEDWKSHKAPRH